MESSPQEVLVNGIKKIHCKSNVSSLKEKTPMCLVNELARFNQIPHQYRLTHEDGPAHKKVFTVTLKLGDEEYQADGSSIKKAQHSAAQLALNSTDYKHPPEKSTKPITSRRNITPTVELNALAMKRGEVTEYTIVEEPPYDQSNRGLLHGHHVRFRGRGFRGYRPFKRGFHHPRGPAFIAPQLPFTEGTYKVLLKVNSREYTGCGTSPQAARHDAATQALAHYMREIVPQDDQEHGEGEETVPVCPDDRKSPVSVVHEMALKRKLTVTFEVVEEKGQPHMRMYYTRCTVGNLVTMGEGNGKKISKGKAAELMLQELNKLPEVTENPKARFKRRMGTAVTSNNTRGGKRKGDRNATTNDENDNPATLENRSKKDEPCYVQELLTYQTSQGGIEPVYQVVETKLIPNSKKKEFTMQVSIGDKTVLAISSNKKAAMRNAAHMMLIELGASSPKLPAKKKPAKKSPAGKQRDKKEMKRNGVDDSPLVVAVQRDVSGAVEGGGVSRQLVPGMSPDKTARIAKEYLSTGSSPTAEALTRRRKNRKQPAASLRFSHPKDQLCYLAQLAGFSVQYSDFPNPDSQPGPAGATQGSLSLVHLSTSPPQVCTGVGATIEESQNEAAISALKFISDMGLESVSGIKPDTLAPSLQNKKPETNRSFLLQNGECPVTPSSSHNHHSPE